MRISLPASLALGLVALAAPSAQADTLQDHVAPDEAYTFELQNGFHLEWTVRSVSADAVVYDSKTYHNGQQVGPSVTQTWTLGGPAPATPPGDVIEGEIVPGQGLPGGKRYESHTFFGSPGDHVTVDMNSDEFDTYLILIGPSGDVIGENDDFGSIQRSQVEADLYEEGEYEVRCTTFSAHSYGDYEFSVEVESDEGGTGFGGGGSITEDSPSISNKYYVEHTLQVEAGRTYAVYLTSDSVDTYLIVNDPDGNQVLEIDDFVGTGAGFQQSFDRGGEYTLLCTTFSEGATGAYALTIIEDPDPSMPFDPTLRFDGEEPYEVSGRSGPEALRTYRYVREGSQAWVRVADIDGQVTPVFPGVVRLEQYGETLQTLQQVEQVSSSTVNPEGLTRPGPIRPSADRVDVSHVRAGQRYHFEMMNNMAQEWEVVAVEPTVIRYRALTFMNGEPLSGVEAIEIDWPIPMAGEAFVGGPEVEWLGEREFTISGHTFNCRGLRTQDVETWIPLSPGGDITFPGYIRSEMPHGVIELTRIEE
jgi:hypothetical protein